ncbi:MAG: hypothetical protein WBC85_06300, partial [Planktotalea sp.]
MKRIILTAFALGALAACSPEIPDSGAGVGFGDYNAYEQQQAARDAALQGSTLPAPQAVSSETLAPASATGIAPSATTDT